MFLVDLILELGAGRLYFVGNGCLVDSAGHVLIGVGAWPRMQTISFCQLALDIVCRSCSSFGNGAQWIMQVVQFFVEMCV